MKWILFVPLIVRFLLPCARRANLLNYPYFHSLASGVFNSWLSSNMSPVFGSITVLIFIMSDINFSSSADRWMVTFALWETIGLEKLRIRVDCRSVGCGEGVVAGVCNLGTIVVSLEWSWNLGTIVGPFDWTIYLGTLLGVGGLVGGSRRSRLLNIPLRSIRVFWIWCL